MRCTAFLLAAALVAALPVPSAAQQTGLPTLPQDRPRIVLPERAGDTNISVVTDERQIAIAAALVLAGYSTPSDPPSALALRAETRKALASLDPSLRARIEEFYREHRLPEPEKGKPRDESVESIRYRALGVLMNPPPTLTISVNTAKIPPDVQSVLGFAPLVGDLYRSPTFRAALPRLLEVYGDANDRLAAQARFVVGDTLDYLHMKPVQQIEIPARRAPDGKILRPALTRIRSLKIYIDPILAGSPVVRGDLVDAGDAPDAQRPGDRYAVFATGSLTVDEASIRRGLIRYAIDPLIEFAEEDIRAQGEMIDKILARHPVADTRYKAARLALVADSLTAAIEARLRLRSRPLLRNTTLAALGDEYEHDGKALALHFFDRLKRFEEVGVDFTVFFPEMIASIALDKEKNRAEQIAAARAASAAERPAATATAEDVTATRIITADKLILEKRFAEARPLLVQVLEASPNNARALFGLAQVVENTIDPIERSPEADDDAREQAQTERLETAVNLYRRAAGQAGMPERWIASWSHVYAGRILDFLSLREEAVAEYQAAIKLGDVSKGAYREATAGLQTPYAPQTP